MEAKLRSILMLFAATMLGLYGTTDVRGAAFTFQVEFTTGSLAGNSYVGGFSTETTPPDKWVPEGSDAYGGNASILQSLQITVFGQHFDMADDVDFPDLPRVLIGDPGIAIFDYIADNGFETFSVQFYANESNVVRFGGTTSDAESHGTLVSVNLFNDPAGSDQEAVPVPPLVGPDRFAGFSAREVRAAFPATAIAEPSILFLFALGLVALAGARRR